MLGLIGSTNDIQHQKKKKRDRESRFCDTPSLFQRRKNRIMSNRNDMWGHAKGPTTYIIWRQLQLRNVGEEGKRERRRGRKMQSKAKKSRVKGADDFVKTTGAGMLVCYCWTQQTKVKGSLMIMLRWSDGCAWFVSYLYSSYSTLVIDQTVTHLCPILDGGGCVVHCCCNHPTTTEEEEEEGERASLLLCSVLPRRRKKRRRI